MRNGVSTGAGSSTRRLVVVLSLWGLGVAGACRTQALAPAPAPTQGARAKGLAMNCRDGGSPGRSGTIHIRPSGFQPSADCFEPGGEVTFTSHCKQQLTIKFSQDGGVAPFVDGGWTVSLDTQHPVAKNVSTNASGVYDTDQVNCDADDGGIFEVPITGTLEVATSGTGHQPE